MKLQKNIFILIVFIFVLVQCRGLLTRQDEVDKAQIKKLHSTEKKAIEEKDYVTLQTMWIEEGVMLPPGDGPIRGMEAIIEWNQAHKPDSSVVELIKMEQDFEEIQVAGAWAFEWGEYNASLRMIASGDTVVSNGKILRVLQKDSKGNWKIARSMWNEN